MLILIGTVPTAYALNHAVTPGQTQDFVAVSHLAVASFDKYVSPAVTVGDVREEIADYIRTHGFKPYTVLALCQIVNDIANEMTISATAAQPGRSETYPP